MRTPNALASLMKPCSVFLLLDYNGKHKYTGNMDSINM